MKSYIITATFINPRKVQETYIQDTGPVFTKKASNIICKTMIKKRNCVGVKVVEKDEGL